MSVVLLLSIAIDVAGACWSLVVALRRRDWRAAVFTLLFAVMAIRQILALTSSGAASPISVTASLEELAGLAASVLALLGFVSLAAALRSRPTQGQPVAVAGSASDPATGAGAGGAPAAAPTLVVLLIGVIVSVTVALLVQSGTHERWERQFSQRAAARTSLLRHNISGTVEAVRRIADPGLAGVSLDRAIFARLARAELQEWGAIQALGWIPRVGASRRSGYEETARRDGHPGFVFTEQGPARELVSASPREEYFPAYYVEPLDGNEATLGFDLGSKVTFLGALQDARDSGAIRTVAWIAPDRENADRPAILILQPVYRSDAGPAHTVEGRRERLLGFGFGVVRVAGLVELPQGHIESDTSSIRTLVFDLSSPAGEQLLYPESATPKSPSEIRFPLCISSTIAVGPHQWLVTQCPEHYATFAAMRFGLSFLYSPPGTWGQAVAVMVSGLLFTVLLVAYVRGSVLRRVHEQISSTALSRYRTLFDQLPVSVWEEDWSSVKRRLDDLVDAGRDPREYFREHPRELLDLEEGIRVLDVNPFTYQLYKVPEGADFRSFTADAGSFHGFREGVFQLHAGAERVTSEGEQRTYGGDEVITQGTVCIPDDHRDDWGRVLSISHDVTQLHEMRREQLRAAADLKQLIDTANAPIFVADSSGRLCEWNQAAVRVTGFTKDELLGRSLIAELIVDEDRASVREVLERALAGDETVSFECSLCTKDGQRVNVLLNLTVRRDVSGDAVGVVGVAQDITKRKKAEARMYQASKMATLGEMATSVAHELNQPLNVIRMAAGNSLRRLARGAIDAAYLSAKLERVVDQTERAASIIGHMRMFGGNMQEPQLPVDPRETVTGALDLFGEALRLSGIEVATELPERCRRVMGRRFQLEQVLLNLLTNAREAILENAGGRPRRVTLRVRDTGKSEVCIEVQDTGGGIPRAALQRIFEPFYTTKEIGKGTGLGLSLSYGIIRDMGGAIEVENVNGGARFLIALPAAEQEQRAP